jgi:hypothetical protein
MNGIGHLRRGGRRTSAESSGGTPDFGSNLSFRAWVGTRFGSSASWGARELDPRVLTVVRATTAAGG